MLLAAGLAFSLLCGSAYAESLEDYTKPAIHPPVTSSSAYGGKTKGVYVLPGTFAPKGELPALPKKKAVRTPPPLPEKKLPDIRSLSDFSETHPAETPQMFRATTPATRGTSALTASGQAAYTPRFRPAPAPLVVEPEATEPVVDAPAEGQWIALDAPAATPVASPPPVMKQAPAPQVAEAPPVVSPPVVSAPPAPVIAAPVVVTRPKVTEYVPPSPVMPKPAPRVSASAPRQPVELAPAPVHDGPIYVKKQVAVPTPAAPLVEQPLNTIPDMVAAPAPLPVPAEKTITEVIEVPASETNATLEVPTETSLLVPVEPVEKRDLSPESKSILHKTPSGIDTPRTVARTPKPIVVTRSEKPDALDVRSHESLGLKIEVRKAPPDIAGFLQQGYDHLMAGNLSIAAGFYEQAVQNAPKNEQALFGLATTYQRIGRRDEARDIYGKLLALNPTHREGLNNFMVLLADESPLAAIEALEQLETENPDFSPIPAQLGSVYNRIGNHEMAAHKLARALQLSPDNIAYKYNLAIALDKLGDKKQASDLYMELIEAYNLGGTLPGNVEDIRNRVIFLNR